MIKEINAIPGNTWKAGINPRFEHEKLGSASKLMGVKLEDSKAELFKLAKQAPELPKGFKAPDAFDSETNWPEVSKSPPNLPVAAFIAAADRQYVVDPTSNLSFIVL